MSINRRLPDEITTLLNAAGSRRAFLRSSAATAIAAGTLVACKAGGQQPQKAAQDSDHSGGTTAVHPVAATAASPAEEMDRMHEAGIKSFPAKTEGKGNQILAPRMDKGVRCSISPHRRSSGRSSLAGASRHGPTTARFPGRRSAFARATGFA